MRFSVANQHYLVVMPGSLSTLVVADSTLIFNDTVDNLMMASQNVRCDVVGGRTFHKHSWNNALQSKNQPNFFEHIVVLCAGNDTRKGGRCRQWIYEGALQNMKTQLKLLQQHCELMTFVLVGDWHMWGKGYTNAEDPHAEQWFDGCMFELETTALEVLRPRDGGNRFLRWKSDTLRHLPLRDAWHFSVAAKPKLLALVLSLVGFGAQPQPEMPAGTQGYATNPAQMDHITSEPDFDASKRATLADRISCKESMVRLAALMQPLPEHQSGLKNTELHDVLFHDIMGASRGRTSKSNNHLAGWRRFFDANDLLAWKALKAAVDSTVLASSPTPSNRSVAKRQFEASDNDSQRQNTYQEASTSFMVVNCLVFNFGNKRRNPADNAKLFEVID